MVPPTEGFITGSTEAFLKAHLCLGPPPHVNPTLILSVCYSVLLLFLVWCQVKEIQHTLMVSVGGIFVGFHIIVVLTFNALNKSFSRNWKCHSPFWVLILLSCPSLLVAPMDTLSTTSNTYSVT